MAMEVMCSLMVLSAQIFRGRASRRRQFANLNQEPS